MHMSIVWWVEAPRVMGTALCWPSKGAAAVQQREAMTAIGGQERGFLYKLDGRMLMGAWAESLDGLRAHLQRPALPRMAPQ